MWLVGNLQANNSQLSVECVRGESAKGRGVRRAATWLIFATWKFVNACQAKRRTPVNNSLTDFLTSWLTEWVSEWLTDALRMITEIACDCQLGFSFGFGFNQSENKTKKKAATIFFATDALFMDPKQTRKRNSFLPVFHQFGSNCFCWWAWGQLVDGEGKEGRTGVSGDKVAGNRRKQLLIDFGLPFGIWQISCLSCCVADDVGRTVESVRRVVYMLQHFPPSPAPHSIPGLSQLRSLWQMCVDCWLKLPNWQTAEKRRLKKKWSRELSNSRKNRNKYRGKGKGECGGRYRNKATNLGFNK